MITYDKGWWGNRVLFRAYGSAFPRSLLYSCMAAALAAALSAVFQTTGWELFNNPYPLQLFFFVVGFMVIFRNNLSYGRYWEGRSQLQQMTGKLTEAVRTILNYDRITLSNAKSPEEEAEEHRWFCDTLIHLVSLFHAVALATLRSDYDMENLIVHDSRSRAPPRNARLQARSRAKHGRSTLRRRRMDPEDSEGRSQNHGGGSGEEGLAGATERGARGARGRTMLSNAWAGSRSILDYFVLRTDPLRAQETYRSMKLPVIGGLTQAEGEALGAFSTNSDLGVHGIMLENGTYTPGHTERAQAIASWIHECMVERIHAAGDKCPLSHMILQVFGYINFEGAFIAFEHCQKLTDTPVPFPWVQAINITLLIFAVLVPFAIASFVHSMFTAVILPFVVVSTYVTLNEVASDIEDPFHYDPNELPLPQMQYRLNERLLAILYSERPAAFTDVGGLTGPGNTVASPAVDANSAGRPEAAASLSAAMAALAGGNQAFPTLRGFGGCSRFSALTQAALASAGGAGPQAAGSAERDGFQLRHAAANRSQGSSFRCDPSSAAAPTTVYGLAARFRFAAAAARAENAEPAQRGAPAAHSKHPQCVGSPHGAPPTTRTPLAPIDCSSEGSESEIGLPPPPLPQSSKQGTGMSEISVVSARPLGTP